MSEIIPAIPSATLLPQPSPMELLSIAVQSGQGVEVLDRLMTLQERWEANNARKAFDSAIADAKAEIPIVIKSCIVSYPTQGKGSDKVAYLHEDFAAIARAIDPVLSKHGLSYRFRTHCGNGDVTVVCIIAHRGGYTEETSLTGPHDRTGSKNALQAIESTVTYLQRYTLKAALGIAAGHDDDGKGGAKLAPKPSGTDIVAAAKAKPEPIPVAADPEIEAVEERLNILMSESDLSSSELDEALSALYGKPVRWFDLPTKTLSALVQPERWAKVLSAAGKEVEA